MTTTTTSVSSESSVKRAGGAPKGPRAPRPKLSVAMETPRRKVSYEIRESAEALIARYAEFLTQYERFPVSPSAVIEGMVKSVIEGDELFKTFCESSSGASRATAVKGAKA
jgi:hypothetical protein